MGSSGGGGGAAMLRDEAAVATAWRRAAGVAAQLVPPPLCRCTTAAAAAAATNAAACRGATVLVGGAVMDLQARWVSLVSVPFTLHNVSRPPAHASGRACVQAWPAPGTAPRAGTTVPGEVRATPGGVARNIAAVLAALAAGGGGSDGGSEERPPPPLLISAVGDDAAGAALLAHMRCAHLAAAGAAARVAACSWRDLISRPRLKTGRWGCRRAAFASSRARAPPPWRLCSARTATSSPPWRTARCWRRS
jgi:hypothetical protein